MSHVACVDTSSGCRGLVDWHGGCRCHAGASTATRACDGLARGSSRRRQAGTCLGCHNQRVKAGGLTLDAIDWSRPAAHAEVLEKVVLKVRGGLMPPAGVPTPPDEARAALASYLETSLDAAAAAAPNPGRPALHRLNRAEYANAIRDLLALDIDPALLLPPDDSSDGFDNNADVLGVSPALLERYLAAARKIGALALGDRAGERLHRRLSRAAGHVAVAAPRGPSPWHAGRARGRPHVSERRRIRHQGQAAGDHARPDPRPRVRQSRRGVAGRPAHPPRGSGRPRGLRRSGRQRDRCAEQHRRPAHRARAGDRRSACRSRRVHRTQRRAGWVSPPAVPSHERRHDGSHGLRTHRERQHRRTVRPRSVCKDAESRPHFRLSSGDTSRRSRHAHDRSSRRSRAGRTVVR